MQKRSEETRSNLLKAAVKRFSQSGYEATGVAEICEEAGVSKGAFYHHFPTKQAVFITLLEDWLDSLDAEMSRILRDAGSVPEGLLRMAAMTREVFQDASGKLPMFMEFLTQARRDPEVWKTTIAPYRRYQDYFEQIIKKGIAEGSLEPIDAKLAAQTIVSLAVGLLLQGVLDPQGCVWHEVVRQSIELLLHGMVRRSS